MPKVRFDWESEYRDPISDKEDRLQSEAEEWLNAEIMAEIKHCRRMEEFARQEREARERELEEHYDNYDPYYDYWPPYDPPSLP
jgi:hypothetical protein